MINFIFYAAMSVATNYCNLPNGQKKDLGLTEHYRKELQCQLKKIRLLEHTTDGVSLAAKLHFLSFFLRLLDSSVYCSATQPHPLVSEWDLEMNANLYKFSDFPISEQQAIIEMLILQLVNLP